MYARYMPPSKGQKASKSQEAAPAPEQSPASAPASTAKVPGDGFSYSRYVPGAKPEKKPEEPTIQYFNDEPSPLKPKRKRDEESQEPRSKKSKRIKEKQDLDVGAEAQTQDRGLDDGAQKIKKSKSEGDVPENSEEETGHGKNKETKSRKNGKRKEEALDEVEQLNAISKDNDADMVDADASAVDEDATETLEAGESMDLKGKKRKKEKKRKPQDITSRKQAVEDDKDEQRHKAVFDRKAKSLKFAEATKDQATAQAPEEPVELHGLEPLPQPEPAAPSTAKPTYETLPSWLSAPIRVSQATRTSFTDLGLLPRPARILQEKGYSQAFAVQTAAIPLLLPTSKQQPGDLLISAATGSGKTLAYALPIVRDLSNSVVTRLRALVVLPTRELVKQVQEVFELCARAHEGEDRKRVRVGVAIGSQSIASERESLMGSESRYDPEAYRQLKAQKALQGAAVSDAYDILTGAGTEEEDPRIGSWEGQVVDFYSKVDVLICTPGRLVEHIEQTAGFSLDYARWLVVDEADKLLAQSFQGWLDVVLEKFKISKFSARDFPDMAYSGVRKVILSATLTRDLSLLGQLALRRPQLIVLESDGDVQAAEHSLPALLREFAVRVHDANLKPLYLLDLLRSKQMAAEDHKSGLDGSVETKELANSDSSSKASSDSDSDVTSDSDVSSDPDSGEEDDDTPSKHTELQIPMSLIFTKSNESALRLSRLLTLLDKSLAAHISTLTSTTPTSIRRKTLRAFTTPSSPLRLIIASDLVARGIDIPKLSHVINYDLPPSVAGYVHRVGRTARAGRSGCAWTLVGDGESGWFWGKIAKGAGIRRAQKVERARIEEMGDERIEELEAALEKLGKEALDSRRR